MLHPYPANLAERTDNKLHQLRQDAQRGKLRISDYPEKVSNLMTKLLIDHKREEWLYTPTDEVTRHLVELDDGSYLTWERSALRDYMLVNIPTVDTRHYIKKQARKQQEAAVLA